MVGERYLGSEGDACLQHDLIQLGFVSPELMDNLRLHVFNAIPTTGAQIPQLEFSGPADSLQVEAQGDGSGQATPIYIGSAVRGAARGTYDAADHMATILGAPLGLGASADEQAPPIHGRSWRSRFDALPLPWRVTIAAGALGSVLAGGGVALAHAPGFDRDDRSACASPTTELVEASSWETVANQLTQDRYPVNPVELAQLNPQAMDETTGRVVALRPASGGFQSQITAQPGDLLCVIVPAPLAAGQYMTDGTLSVNQIASKMAVDPADIVKFNGKAGVLPVDLDKPLPVGLRLWYQAKPDTRLTYQPLHGSFKEETKGDSKQAIAILNVNPQAIGEDGITFEEGHGYYLLFDSRDVTVYMEKHNLTAEGIVTAFTQAGAFDYQKRGSGLRPPTTAPNPEASSTATHITPEQQKIIDAMPIDAEQKKFVATCVEQIMQHRDAIQKAGVNADVMLAQALEESGYNTSKLALQAHNYFGIKAQKGDGWTGATMQHEGATYRKYPDVAAGFQGYIDNLMKKWWYDDARQFPQDDNKFLLGLLGAIDQDGDVIIVQNAQGAYSYATDPQYRTKILGVIDVNHINSLFKIFVYPEHTGAPYVAPQPKTPESSKGSWVVRPLPDVSTIQPGKIALNRRLYQNRTRHQGDLNVNRSEGAFIVIDGQKVLLKDLSETTRVQIIQRELNGADPTLAGYQDFFAHHFHDISTQIAKTPGLTNFHGQQNHRGTVKDVRKEIKYFVMHYTATNNSTNSGTGLDAAWSMQNSNRSNGNQMIGSWGYCNDAGEMWQLIDDDHVVNVLDFNDVTWGVENAAAGQETINSKQYTNDVYIAAYFLTKYGYVQKGASVSNVVYSVIRGHGEFAEVSSGDHMDYPQLVMDPIREMIIQFLVKMGYTR